MSIVRVGSNQKYADGWGAAFGGKKKAKSATVTTAKKKTAKKKVATKKAAKKKAKK